MSGAVLVVLGMRRSGLGLVRAMLDSHPRLAIAPASPLSRLVLEPNGPEGEPFDPRRFIAALYADQAVQRWGVPKSVLDGAFVERQPEGPADAVRRFLTLWATTRGRATPGLVAWDQTLRVDQLAERLPEARIIQVIRDGRDVAASVLEQGWAERIEPVALDWRRGVRRARNAGRRIGDGGPDGRYHEVRYEELVADPVVTLRLLCDALDLPFSPAMLSYQDSAARALKATGRAHENRYLTRTLMRHLRDWRRDLPSGAVARFEALAGDLLAELGYPLQRPRPSAAAVLATRRAWLKWHRKQLRGR